MKARIQNLSPDAALADASVGLQLQVNVFLRNGSNKRKAEAVEEDEAPMSNADLTEEADLTVEFKAEPSWVNVKSSYTFRGHEREQVPLSINLGPYVLWPSIWWPDYAHRDESQVWVNVGAQEHTG
ncbi:hypothetical protein J3F84DRAFT_349273 [Trichoderma pleuroticola]